MKQLTIRKIKEEVKMHLDQNRYEHTLGVMYTAGALAMRYGADLEDTMIAGLLHDCAKCIPSAQKIELCKKYNLNISEAEQKNPGLLHAKLGAYLAKEMYQIENTEILDAISCHTTGLAFTDIDECLYTILHASLEYLKSKSEVIDPLTEQTYLYYNERRI